MEIYQPGAVIIVITLMLYLLRFAQSDSMELISLSLDRG
jgi:hypothetical protein